jgi:hypothetical protein
VVLPAFAADGTGLVWTWFATAWAYAILVVTILLLPAGSAVAGRVDSAPSALTVGAMAGLIIGVACTPSSCARLEPADQDSAAIHVSQCKKFRGVSNLPAHLCVSNF